MKTRRKIALLIVALLLFAFCQTTYAEGDSISDIELFVCETTTVFDDSGEEIGQLFQDESGAYIFHQSSEDGTENVARVFLQRSIANRNTDDEQADLAGKCAIKIVLEDNEAAANTENSETSSDTSASQSGNSDSVVTGWIDSDTVIDALIQTDTDRSEEVFLLEGEIGALQANVDRLTTELQEKDTEVKAAEDEPVMVDTDEEPSVDVLAIIQLCITALIAGGIVWFAFQWKANSAQNEHGELPKKEEETKTPATINQTITIKHEIPKMPEDFFKIIMKFADALLQQKESEQSSQTEGTESIDKQEQDPEPKTPDEERIRKENYQKALDLSNALSGTRASALWQKKVSDHKFQYMLLELARDDKTAFMETQNSDALYAAIWNPDVSAMKFLVPSCVDENARRNQWEDFYNVENRNDDKAGYKIEELTEVSLRDSFFHIAKRGKMIRYTRNAN